MNTIEATSVVLMQEFQGGMPVRMYAQKRPGTAPRTENFYPGAWRRADDTYFFVSEEMSVIEAATPEDLYRKVKESQSVPLKRAA